MPRDSSHKGKKVALLATGDEIIKGDIQNSNAQIIAQKLFAQGITLGTHMAVGDNIEEIQQAIQLLLNDHQGLIITGGLGPTSDDITRYALSQAIQRPLTFDEPTWEGICDRFKQLGYQGEPPEGNRQQALFPEGATIISNPRGTAAGCFIHTNHHSIFMLPGPPFECLPMVDQIVIEELKEKNFQSLFFYDQWLLFGIGESLIANQLDGIAAPFACTTGYRIAFPYIEFKLISQHQEDFMECVKLISPIISPYLLGHGKQPASVELLKTLETGAFKINIHDYATGGLLENTLVTPDSARFISFSQKEKPDLTIKGLREYWGNQDTQETSLELDSNGIKEHKPIPLRGRTARVKQYAAEYICHRILSIWIH